MFTAAPAPPMTAPMKKDLQKLETPLDLLIPPAGPVELSPTAIGGYSSQNSPTHSSHSDVSSSAFSDDEIGIS